MSSNLKVNTILPSVGSNIGLGTDGGNLNVDGGCKVQVGTALTLGHTQGLQFHTQNLHSTGFELNQVNVSGLSTFSSNVTIGGSITNSILVTGIVTATGRVGVGTNTTAERNSLPAPKAGHLIMNATSNLLEYYNGTAWTPIDTPPTVTSVNNSNVLETQIASGFDLVITGTNFKSGATVTFIGNDGTEHISPSVAVNSTTQITARVHTSVSNSNEPYDVKVTNSAGLSGILEDAFNINAKPIWTTAAGILTTINGNATGIHTTIAATDPESDTVTYTGTVGGGLSLNSSTGAISGDPTDVSSNTTLSFTATATSSSSNTTPRNFSVVVTPAPHLGNCEVWFDPRRFSSLANGSTCTSHPSCLQPSVTWTLVTNGTASYDSSASSSQGIKVGSTTHELKFITYNQDVTAFDNLQNYSFEFWVYVGAQDINGWGFIGGKSRFWSANDGGIFINVDGENWGPHTSNGSGGITDMASNGWHHLVFVRNISDSNCRKFYVDNSIAVENNGGDGSADHILNNNAALTIGCSTDGNISPTSATQYAPKNDFRYGHARFYSKALTAAQINQNWMAEKAIYGL